MEELKTTKRKGRYYVLELDNYNQPTGTIKEVFLTKEEAENTAYCFKKYVEAYYRAVD